MGASLAACGGGGGGSLPSGAPVAIPTALTGVPTPSATQPSSIATTGPGTVATTGPGGVATTAPIVTQAVTLNIVIPKSTTSAAKRRAQYIPSNTGSLSLTLLSVNGTQLPNQSVQGPFDVTPGPSNPHCSVSASTGNATCSFSVDAPVGSDIFVANTYASSDGSGPSLGSGAIALSVQINALNTASFVLSGPVKSVSLLSATTALFNGNPVPQPSPTLTPTSLKRARLGSIATPIPTPSPTPLATPTPTVTTSRIFVIAVDAAGNQIINPTTFDIPIVIRLSANGLPAGAVTLTATYVGLPGEPSSAASTSSDGGSVTVYAPSDTVTLALGGATATGSFAPSLTALYTPQGGSPQTSPALAYSVSVPAPAAVFAATATHAGSTFVDQTPLDLTFSVKNIGNAATSGVVTVTGSILEYPTFNAFPNLSPFWSCANTTPTPGSFAATFTCTSTTPLAPNATAPSIDANVTPNGAPIYAAISVGGGGSANTAYAYDSLAVVPQTGPVLSFTPPYHTHTVGDGNFMIGVPGTITLTLANSGTAATSGTTTVTDTLPAGMSLSSATGSGWACGGTTTVTCTTGTPIAAGATAATITLNVTGASTAGPATNSFAASGAGVTFIGASSESILVYGLFSFTGATTHNFTGEPSQPLGLTESYFTGWTTTATPAGCVGSVVNVDLVNNIVTPAGAGSCSFTVSDAFGNTTPSIGATVTTLTINPQSVRHR